MGENIIDRDRFKLGFELETQSLFGESYGQYRASATIDKRATQARDECFMRDTLSGSTDTHGVLRQLLGPRHINATFDSVGIQIRRAVLQQNIDLSARVQEVFADILATIPPVYTRERCDSDYFSAKLDNRFNVERDGTVSGPEIITKGGNTPEKLRELSRYVFQHEMKVDEGCSFHLHLSVDGFRHMYGRSLQRFMVQYILQNMHRVPKPVLRRWIEKNHHNKMQYFTLDPNSDQGRYAFVAYRSEEGTRKPPTWEFRCWGNIDNLEDASACIELSIEAYTYAHTQAVLLHKIYTRDWVSVKEAILAKAHFILNGTHQERVAL